jgi:aminopeptidase-like protein
VYVNQYPKCEPQLGKRGLYVSLGGQTGGKTRELAMLWLLNLSDGNGFSLLDIAEKSGIKFADLREAADRLAENGLLTELQSKQ